MKLHEADQSCSEFYLCASHSLIENVSTVGSRLAMQPASTVSGKATDLLSLQ